MEKKKVYIVHETYNNDGEITNSIIAVSFDKEKAREAMRKQFEEYKQSDTFRIEEDDDEDEIIIEEDEDSMYIAIACDDYSADLEILSQEII